MAKPENSGHPPATSATTATNEWGLPDWRDPAAYGDVKRWEFMRWRWEFYRRRDDLRAAFDANAEQTYHFYLEANLLGGGKGQILKPDEPGFCARLPTDAAMGFGYAGLPNPRVSEQPAHILFSVLEYPGNISMIIGKGPRFPDSPEGYCGIGDGELAAIFDLDKPIGPQVEGLKESLKAWQVIRHVAALQKRRHPAKWLGYLRTLDAREDGASWAKIAALHPNTAQTEQTARDIWDAANALRFNF